MLFQKMPQVGSGGSESKNIDLSLLPCVNPTASGKSGSSTISYPFASSIVQDSGGWTSTQNQTDAWIQWEFDKEKYVEAICIFLSTNTKDTDFQIQYKTNADGQWESIPYRFEKNTASYVFAVRKKCKFMRLFSPKGFYVGSYYTMISKGGIRVLGEA